MAEHRRSPNQAPDSPAEADGERGLLGRRRVLGYLLAAPTLAVGVSWIADTADPRKAEAAVPTLPQPEEIFDLGDLQNLAAAPTSGLISVQVHYRRHRVVRRAPRRGRPGHDHGDRDDDRRGAGPADGQGHASTLADARPELLMNQLTGGSNSMRSIVPPGPDRRGDRPAAAGGHGRRAVGRRPPELTTQAA